MPFVPYLFAQDSGKGQIVTNSARLNFAHQDCACAIRMVCWKSFDSFNAERYREGENRGQYFWEGSQIVMAYDRV